MALVKPVEWWSGWSDILGITAVILGGFLAFVTLLGWTFSWKAGRLKDDALKRYQAEATQSIAEANKAASVANQQASGGKSRTRFTTGQDGAAKAHQRATREIGFTS